MQAPKAKKIPHLLETHGHQRTDNYYWMRDRENPEVIAYLTAENEYLKTSLKSTEDFQEKLFQEMKGRIKEDDESVPYLKSGYYWYAKYETGGEYPLYCRKKGSLDAPEEVFLNVNQLAEGKSYYQVGGTAATSDLKTLAFAADEVGRRIYTIYFKNLETGEILADQIPAITGNYAWAEDNQTLFYSKQDPDTLRSYQIYSHKLGTSTAEDLLIYTEKDEEFSCMVHKTKSEKFILIHSESTISSEMRFLDASNPTGEFTLLQARIPHLEYAADHYGEHFWIKTNLNAQNFKLVKAPISSPQLANWEDVIPHRESVLLEDFDIFSDFLVVQERTKGLCKINIKPWDGTASHFLEFDDETYTAWISTNPEFDTPILRFGYNSLVTPASTFDYHMVTKEKTLLKQQEIIGGYDASQY
ncbi:MAG: oligopeptidase B, partial [Algoriphagus sp.]